MNRKLYRCPTCNRELDPVTREAMGLRNGEALNSRCPDKTGPSDIDNVLHNGKIFPERIFFPEYKRNGAEPRRGQLWVFNSLRGDWKEENNGRRIQIRYGILPQHPEDPESVLRPIIDWVWPPREK